MAMSSRSLCRRTRNGRAQVLTRVPLLGATLRFLLIIAGISSLVSMLR
jgi:hypothetical protein